MAHRSGETNTGQNPKLQGLLLIHRDRIPLGMTVLRKKS